ncbi:MAG TPA: hypothetical protein VE591_05610 [Candidatus Acidoferrum sp.]|nr:hypothetical protein [Candidatus Acidoferrum sp.]
MFSTTGMKGGGYYDANSGPQRGFLETATMLMRSEIRTMRLPPAPEPITIVDYGSAEGRNAIVATRPLVAELRRRTDQSVHLVYNDVPTNDFKQLVTNIAAAEFPAGVHAFASGRSFYEQICASGSVAIAHSSSALHWLSASPARGIKEHSFAPFADEDERRAFSAQAEGDWTVFLRHRAVELRPGGKLLAFMLGNDNGACGLAKPFDLLDSLLREMVAEGSVSGAAYDALACPLHWRTIDEVLAPITGENAPLAGLYRVEHVGFHAAPCALIAEYRQSGDAERYAERFTGTLRAAMEGLIANAIFGGDQEAPGLDELFDRLRNGIAMEPERYRFDFAQLYVLFTRTDATVPSTSQSRNGSAAPTSPTIRAV